MKITYLITLGMVLAVGVAVITGLANALEKADVKAPIADSRLVKGRQIDVATINGQVMLRRKVDVDAVRQRAEDLAKRLDGVKSVRNAFEVVDPSTGEAVEGRQGSMEFDVKKGQAIQSHGLHADRVKLMIIYSLFLRSMRPLGHA